MLHFPSVLMNRLNKAESAVFLYCRFSLFLKDKTESAVFLYCRFSLFLKNPFSRLFRGRKACARGVRNVAFSICSHEQTQ